MGTERPQVGERYFYYYDNKAVEVIGNKDGVIYYRWELSGMISEIPIDMWAELMDDPRSRIHRIPRFRHAPSLITELPGGKVCE